jgi:hypothetical protein
MAVVVKPAYGLENGRSVAHIRRMTTRDEWTEKLQCPVCGRTGSAELSQANGQAFHDGDQAVRVDHVSEGFKAVQFEYGSNFYCSSCDSPVVKWTPEIGPNVKV